jgi:hypothetical protein
MSNLMPDILIRVALQSNRMDQTVRVFKSHREMKAAEYRYWQSRPVYERMQAVTELVLEASAFKGSPARNADVPRLQRPLICLPRPRR